MASPAEGLAGGHLSPQGSSGETQVPRSVSPGTPRACLAAWAPQIPLGWNAVPIQLHGASGLAITALGWRRAQGLVASGLARWAGITGHSDACCGQRSVANTDMWMQNRDIHLIPTTAEIPPEPCSKLTRPFPGRPPPHLVQSPVMHPRVMLECRSHSFVLLCECSVLPVVSCPLTLLMTLVLST